MNIEAVAASDMTPEEARAAVDAIRHDVDDLIDRLRELWARRAWLALGYDSWDDLCVAEFPNRHLPRGERQAVVVSLRSAGMSIRAIAAATGAAVGTVGDDCASSSVQIRTPATVIGTDGRSYASTATPAGSHIDIIRNLTKLGLGGAAIAEQLGISEGRVYAIAKDNGVAIGKRSRAARAERIERTRQLAAEGATSHQIAVELGVGFEAVRNYCRKHDIVVPADTVTTTRRTLDSTRIVEGTIDVLDGIDAMFDHIDYGALPTREVDDWISVLETSIRSLTTLKRHLKELIQS